MDGKIIARVATAAALAAVLLAACKSTDKSAVKSGALGLRCVLGENRVDEVEYAIVRAGAIARSGSFVVENGRDSFSAVIGPLVPDDSYQITLTGRAAGEIDGGGSSACSGSGAFSVIAGQTTAMSVELRCGVSAERAASDNACPTLDSVRAVPAEAVLGETISLRADAHDADKKLGPLMYWWTADGGELIDSTLARPYFHCMKAGRVTITLKISDGDTTCPEESVTVQVTCKTISNPAAGTAG